MIKNLMSMVSNPQTPKPMPSIGFGNLHPALKGFDPQPDAPEPEPVGSSDPMQIMQKAFALGGKEIGSIPTRNVKTSMGQVVPDIMTKAPQIFGGAQPQMNSPAPMPSSGIPWNMKPLTSPNPMQTASSGGYDINEIFKLLSQGA